MTKDRITKAETLSDTIRYQERVIERLQTMISNYMRQKRLEGWDMDFEMDFIDNLLSFIGTINDIDRTLLTEHAALGRETKYLTVSLAYF